MKNYQHPRNKVFVVENLKLFDLMAIAMC